MRELTVWRPFHTVDWFGNMDSILDRFFHEEGEAHWLPPLEAYEKDGSYLIRLDLPGVDPKSVNVSAESGVLTIAGERQHENQGEKKGHRYRETSYGKFQRRVGLPKGVETDKITARYENGVLEISVPVPAGLTGKKIAVRIEGGEKASEVKAA